MLDNELASEARGGLFFRRIDWQAFWTATAISMAVYLFTLGPSVTLEDSGELAVAGDHLGVPHPPGYPIWTMCAYVFARLFSWVTFRGQPTPAWSISLMSGVFAALAAGLTAMLITRSASDIIRDMHEEGDSDSGFNRDLLCWAGGVGGSLVFAFSPVMWSQATIVEVYTLNAFFLMWIFLMTYRWMRQPSARLLWLLAFVFGLGLTNYQVLLLAALPLVVMIFLRDVPLFRDFIMIGVPVLLTAHILQIGAILGAKPGMIGPAYPKFEPLTRIPVPPVWMLSLGAVLVISGIALGVFMHERGCCANEEKPRRSGVHTTTIVSVGLSALGSLVLLFAGSVSSKPLEVRLLDAPLLPVPIYTSVAALVGLIVACCIGGARKWRSRWNDKPVLPWLVCAMVLMLVLMLRLSTVESATMPPGYAGEPFSWTMPTLALLGGLAVLFALAATVPRGLFFAIPVAAVQISMFTLLRKGGLQGLTHPTTWWFWWPIIWNFVMLGMAWLTLPHGRTVALTALCAELGVSFYGYMPIVSDLRNPPMNWGYPRTWEGFKHAITRGQYEKLTPSDVFSRKFLFQLGSYFTDLRIQFTLVIATLGFLPFTLWSFKTKGRRIRALYVASALYLLTAALVALPGESFLRLDKLLIGVIMLLLLVGFALIISGQVEDFMRHIWQSHNLSESLTVGISLAGALALTTLVLAKGLFSLISGGATDPALGAKFGALCLALTLVAGGGYGWYRLRSYMGRRHDLRFNMDNIAQQWMIATTLAFLVMSVLLVVLANIKGDLQDAFIQKVKFISSHGLFAIWIGYGLVFGLVIGNRIIDALVKSKRVPERVGVGARYALVVAALLSAGIPVLENYTNEYLVFSMSAAEQNGHDFGWQFGNYQLRGADSITEELDADEEPLPNPLFPPEMGTNAIFFGGTDPGRFVPTYMIYSALVRPDVFLITQNALADNTYMATMRSLYSDQIWIPTPDDSAEAFQIYVDEVQAGKRPKNAQLTIENGRVQVSGALGVMEINGILCDMIFSKNKDRHDFYIEESYVMQWMYPYLSPHGLIMKINNEHFPIEEKLRNDDLDFWDWMTRRLLHNPMFRRDLPAQKSFSKLRSAIAGLYASRGMHREAERAYQEARAMYPVSPESNFRLIQEVLMPQRRFDESLLILEEYNERDPNNDRGRGFMEFIQRIQGTEAKVRELTLKAQETQTLSPDDAFELALAYRDLGQTESAAKYLLQLAEAPMTPVDRLFEIAVILSSLKKNEDGARTMDRVMQHLPREVEADRLMDIVRVYGDAGQSEKMVAPLSRYLQMRPNDWHAWLDMATISVLRRQGQQTQFALQRAIEVGGNQALQRIQENPMLRQVWMRQMQQQRGASGHSGLSPLGGRGL